jgi:predicted methyltransferase
MRNRLARAACAAAFALHAGLAHAAAGDACHAPPQAVSLPPDTSPPPGAALAAALNDPARGDVRDADARRRPAAVIGFSGARPGDRIAELIPGKGYFTRIFARLAGPQGHVYLIWPTEYLALTGTKPLEASRALAADPRYGNITVLQQPARAFATPEQVDLVFTAQNFHDYPDAFMGKIDPVSFSRQVYAALKPGGVFLIVDHAAEPGSGLRDTEKLHRIDPAAVRRSVTEAGFIFDGQSTALHNPADPLTQLVFCPSIRGHTDQFMLRFRKPA